MEKKFKNFLLQRNIWTAKTTPPHRVADFLKKVAPVETEFPLIRIGSEGDGGYLVPDDLDGIDACFSAGVSTCSDFEYELAKRGIKCFLADFSVDSPPIESPLFDFEKRYIGPERDERFLTLEKWISLKAPEKNNLILQMDIEDGEYPVIFHTNSETFKKFRIIVIEFHRMNHLFNKDGAELIHLSFEKILLNFDVVHIHPNNCRPTVRSMGFEIPPVMEFTFLRKDRTKQRRARVNFPHLLDRCNSAYAPEIVLPRCWYNLS